MSEPWNVEAEARKLLADLPNGLTETYVIVVLALVRRAETLAYEEAAKHAPYERMGGMLCRECNWKFPAHLSSPWQVSWTAHIIALAKTGGAPPKKRHDADDIDQPKGFHCDDI